MTNLGARDVERVENVELAKQGFEGEKIVVLDYESL